MWAKSLRVMEACTVPIFYLVKEIILLYTRHYLPKAMAFRPNNQFYLAGTFWWTQANYVCLRQLVFTEV